MIKAAPDIHIKRKAIAELLKDVPDPEIPIISIVDLGMVIAIFKQGEKWQIDLAPTYSGCPAIDVIPILVESKLKDAGYKDVIINIEISPPWSTDWISDDGKQKLLHYGIAPPNGISNANSDEGKPKSCPQCGSVETILISRHSSTPCKAAYRCEVCKEPFEYFKCF